jgi:hypothetical protein
MQPVATQVLKHLSRSGEPLMILMDRTMINDGLNLLYVSVGFCGRALPLGWREVPHQGNSDLALQKKLLGWLKECLPQGVEVFIVADREFHSIHLAGWIKLEMGVHFVLRIKAGTWIEIDGQWCRAGEMASIGERRLWKDVRVTRDRKVEYRVNLLTVWERTEDEPWLLISDADEAEEIEGVYKKRYWIEEMFSDHKRRGMNLEATRITDPKRVQRLLVAVALAYLWTMEIGALVVNTQQWRRVDNRGAKRSVSLCQVGLRWLREMLMQSLLPPAFTGQFRPVADG